MNNNLPTFLQDLNPDQLKAAQTINGPVLIQAGAGSGKTKTVIARIMNMIYHGINPNNILAITFTNAAANELKDRIKAVGKANTSGVTACTFHHLCGLILRKYDYQDPIFKKWHQHKNFDIIDDDDQKRIMRNVRDDWLYFDSQSQAKQMDANTLASVKKFSIKRLVYYAENYKLNKAKDNLRIKHGKLKLSANDRQFEFYIVPMIKKYITSTINSNKLSFNDMLTNALYLLQTQPQVRRELQQHYQYVSVDEFQDTSVIQEKIVDLLTKTPSNNLCVVGDPNQSIYGFRGAQISNILNFPKKHKNTTVITLATNYRSTQPILNLANDAISKNPNPYENKVRLVSATGKGTKPKFFVAKNEYDQADTIANIIEKKIAKGYKYKDIGVLYRNNFSALKVQTVFTSKAIPFRTIGTQNLYSHAIIKDLIAYLEIIRNHNDNDSLMRIINTPSRGIGTTTQNLLKWLNVTYPQYSIYDDIAHFNDLIPVLEQAGHRVSKRIPENLLKFHNLISEVPIMGNITIMQVINFILDQCGYGNFVSKLDDANGNDNNKELVDSFRVIANKFDLDHGNQNLLERLNNFSDLLKLNELQETKDNDKDAVQLSTIHGAKGLEYKTVFIIDVADDILPGKRAITASQTGNLTGMQEERRLFYVATTRAKEDLYISYPQESKGWYGPQFQSISRFIAGLPEKDYQIMKSIHSEEGNQFDTNY